MPLADAITSVPDHLRERISVRQYGHSVVVSQHIAFSQRIIPTLFVSVSVFFVIFMYRSRPGFACILGGFVVIMMIMMINRFLRESNRRYELTPSALIVSTSTLLGSFRSSLPNDQILYAYAETEFISDEQDDYAIVVGCSGMTEPHRFGQSDYEIREWIANLIRAYYGVPEFLDLTEPTHLQ